MKRNPPSKNVTISDVARIAGVSISTVSHVINQTHYVGNDTKSRVLAAIESTGYTQNLVAKSLKSAKTNTIGLVISDFRNPFFIDAISGIENALSENGYSLILASSQDSAEAELEQIKSLYARRIDGLILTPTVGSGTQSIPFLKQIQLPTVLCDRYVNAGLDWVGAENMRSTKELVRHLISLGHRDIIFVVGLRGLSTSEERVAGYRAALEEAGIPFEEHNLICGDSRKMPAEERMYQYLSNRNVLPTAIVSANNLMTIGVLRTLDRLSLRVPEDIALASFDDFEWSELFHPKMTALSQPSFDIGRRAAELLLRRIQDPQASRQEEYLSPYLKVRESCGELLHVANTSGSPEDI